MAANSLYEIAMRRVDELVSKDASMEQIIKAVLEVACDEISDTIAAEGPWCDDRSHEETCKCYAFSVSLARNGVSYIRNDIEHYHSRMSFYTIKRHISRYFNKVRDFWFS